MKTYLIRQKIQPFVNQYAVYESDTAGEPGAMIAFAQQKRLALKEKFTAYTNESKTTVAFEIKARQVIDFGARYDVLDATGNQLGVIGKDFKASLLRSTWHVYLPGQEQQPALIVRERDQTVAVIRRIWQLLPIVSDIPFFIKYHFDYTVPATGQTIASYDKTTTLRDHYRLDIHDDDATYDPRLLIALGVMMDALQSR